MDSRLLLATESELLTLATHNYLKASDQLCSISDFLQTDEAIQEYLRKGRISLVLKGINSLMVKYSQCDLSLIVELNLSNNYIKSLEGIESFANLQSLSLCANKIEHWEEFFRVKNKRRLNWLKVEGNPLESHPNYKFELIQLFPRLSILNNNHITEDLRSHLSHTYRTLAHRIVPFAIYLQDLKAHLSNFLKYINISRSLSHEKQKTGNFYASFQMFANEANAAHLSEGVETKLKYFFNISKILRSVKKNAFKAQTDDAEEEVITTTVAQLTHAIMKGAGDFKNFYFTSEELNTTYVKLFRTVLKKYNARNDSSLLDYLKSQVLAKGKDFSDLPVSQPVYDLSIFCESRKYAMECLLIEFYNLYPNKSSIASAIKFQVKNSKRFYFMENWVRDAQSKACSFEGRVPHKDGGQDVGVLPIDCLKENLALNSGFYFNDFFECQVLIDFPFFSLNTRYVLTIFEILLERIDAVITLANESKKIFEQRMRETKTIQKSSGSLSQTKQEGEKNFVQKQEKTSASKMRNNPSHVQTSHQNKTPAKSIKLNPSKGLNKLANLFEKKQKDFFKEWTNLMLQQVILKQNQQRLQRLARGFAVLHNFFDTRIAKGLNKAVGNIKLHAFNDLKRHLRLKILFRILRARVRASKQVSNTPPIILRKYFGALRDKASSKKLAILVVTRYLKRRFQKSSHYYLTKLQLFAQMKKRALQSERSSGLMLPNFPRSFDIEIEHREPDDFRVKKAVSKNRKCEACDQFGFIY